MVPLGIIWCQSDGAFVVGYVQALSRYGSEASVNWLHNKLWVRAAPLVQKLEGRLKTSHCLSHLSEDEAMSRGTNMLLWYLNKKADELATQGLEHSECAPSSAVLQCFKDWCQHLILWQKMQLCILVMRDDNLPYFIAVLVQSCYC